MESLGTHRWTSSGRNRPCPVCGRDVDDKCRRTDAAIHCYQGSRFGPPAALRLGDVLQIEGQRWAVVDLEGGFSASHTVFRPDAGRGDFHPAARQARKRQAADLDPALRDLFCRVRAWVQAAMGIRELHYLIWYEICDARLIVDTAAETLAELRLAILLARRERPELNRLLFAVDVWILRIRYQQADLERFCRSDLGLPAEARR